MDYFARCASWPSHIGQNFTYVYEKYPIIAICYFFSHVDYFTRCASRPPHIGYIVVYVYKNIHELYLACNSLFHYFSQQIQYQCVESSWTIYACLGSLQLPDSLFTDWFQSHGITNVINDLLYLKKKSNIHFIHLRIIPCLPK